MPEQSNNPLNFWQELKRRKVIRVIIVYAAAAYVILELVSIIADPFGLPDWTLKLVFVLLFIGLVLSIILSWVYDITPEGVQRTKPLTRETKSKREKPSRIMGWQIATYASIAIIIGLLMFNILSGKKKSGEFNELENSIAVLQFENLGSDEEQEWFSEGITDIIINQLSKIKEFRVLGRTSTIKYSSGDKTISEIGQELNVNLIIEGTVQRVSDEVRISIQLVRVQNEDHLWSEIYDREWNDIFSIQNDIALNVAKELKTTLSTTEKEQIQKSSTNNSEAYELYLQGRYYWNKRTEEGIRKSIELFEKAINIDKDFAPAYAGLSDAYHVSANWNFIEYDMAERMSIRYALTAILLDKNIAEPYATLGNAADYLFHDIHLQDLCYKRALTINPNYSSAYQWFALRLTIRGEYKAAIKYIERALELDPRSLIINYAAGFIYYYTRDYDKSLTQLERTQTMDTESSIFTRINQRKIMCYLQLQEYDKVLNEYKVNLGDEAILVDYNANAADIFEKEGKNGLINYIISIEQQKKDLSHELLAVLFSHINEKENALDIIEEMIDKRITHYNYILVEPAFDSLHTDQRFVELLGRIGFDLGLMINDL